MVRFKNRHLLVEFLDVSALSAFPPPASVGAPKPEDEDNDSDDDQDILDDAEDEFAPQPTPSAPFMLAQHSTPLFTNPDDATGAIYRAVKESVQALFGDEGWGRVGSSFRGE
jgi:ribonuclease P/MRP protein subunit POP5